MTKKKIDVVDDLPEVPEVVAVRSGRKPWRFVLARNHGLVVVGRACQFYPAGTELDAEKDAELISLLVKSGAQFE